MANEILDHSSPKSEQIPLVTQCGRMIRVKLILPVVVGRKLLCIWDKECSGFILSDPTQRHI